MFIFRRISLGLFLVFMCLLTGCKPQIPSQYLEPDEMEAILYDFHVMTSMTGVHYDKKTDYNKHLYMTEILEKHQVSQAVFDSSLVYYCTHAELLKSVYQNLSTRLEEQVLALGASTGEMNKYSGYSESGDTANIWKQNTEYMLIPIPPYNRIDFQIQSDSIFAAGDVLQLHFMTNFVYQSGTKDAVMYMAVTYDNDSVASYRNQVYMSGLSQLRVTTDHRHKIKSLKGFIYLDKGSDDNNTMKLMFINGVQLIRFHQKNRAVVEPKDTVAAVSPDTVSGKPAVKMISIRRNSHDQP